MKYTLLISLLHIGVFYSANGQGNTPFYLELAQLLRLNEPLCENKPIEVLNLNDSVLTTIYVDPNPGKLNEAKQLLDSITKYHFKDEGIIEDLTKILVLYDNRHLAQYGIDLSTGMYDRSVFSYQMSRFNDGIQRQSRHFEAKPQEIDVIYHLEASILIINELIKNPEELLKYYFRFNRAYPRKPIVLSRTAIHSPFMLMGYIGNFISNNFQYYKLFLLKYAKSDAFHQIDAIKLLKVVEGTPQVGERCSLLKAFLKADSQGLIREALNKRYKNLSQSLHCSEILGD